MVAGERLMGCVVARCSGYAEDPEEGVLGVEEEAAREGGDATGKIAETAHLSVYSIYLGSGYIGTVFIWCSSVHGVKILLV